MPNIFQSITPYHMLDLANKSVDTFRYDQTGQTGYKFNSEGYRSLVEFTESDPIIVIGNSISFGLGIDYSQTFGEIISNKINHPVYNFSIGAYRHSNHYQLLRLNYILDYFQPKHVIYQINNLINVSGHGIEDTVQELDEPKALKTFESFWEDLQHSLSKINHSIIYYDDIDYGVPDVIKNKILIYNRYKVDAAISNMDQTFGPKTHKLIATKLLSVLI